jgi:chitin synthase
MYDDDDGIFMRTTHGVMKNFAYLCKRDRSMTRGKDGWEKVVVCIVSDGRHKINSRMLGVIAAISAYQEGTDINVINSEPVAAHVYEYTTQSAYYRHLLRQLSYVLCSLCHSLSNKIEGVENGIILVQIAFLLEGENQKKISSCL